MRIALISDIHGNAVALEAVLEDIASADVDEVYCLGDIATLGPEPERAIDLIRDLGCPCVLGNHDEFVYAPERILEYTQAPPIVGSIDWCRARLSPEALSFCRSFAPTLQVPLADGSTLLLCHGSPKSNTDNILSTTPPETLDALLAGHDDAVIACGHTHVQMLRQHRGRLIINVGSVGCPFEQFTGGEPPTILPLAEYAIINSTPTGIGVELRRLAPDWTEMRAALDAAEAFPLRASLTPVYQ